MARDKNQVYC